MHSFRDVAESVGNATSRICAGSRSPNKSTEPTVPVEAMQISGSSCSSDECLAKSAVGIGAIKQSLRRICPVSHEGGADNISQGSGNSWYNGSQFTNATRPKMRCHLFNQSPADDDNGNLIPNSWSSSSNRLNLV